ncbi:MULTISPECIES: hypothetical protein [Klebsiella]|uniref:hypothetical protein n=1 Tax=Klebsiella TaxID=570 RepID=UPI0015FA3019|nr:MULTISPECIES: hypothetical protein [Klebsiella]HBR1176904.1 hypothetical protein [Klebsiella quasipneumoniae subsp. similipneumoniae]HBZ3704313.1 hypothetical protein [Klebsiella quasipneumoniae]MBF8466279.1 hypothetical protein [Klebsiella oxytoca]MBG2688143.1 hypothetical protein [Klebsiella oxytoca]MBG2693019.1 hypothetical protein [Klebsiella oxytoca]
MKITGVDFEKSSVEEGMADRYLIIDNITNARFSEFFESELRSHPSMHKRRAVVQGSYVIVTCPLDELQAQVKLLNEICSRVEVKIREHVEDIKRRHEEERQAENLKKDAAHNVFKGLKF